MKQKKQFVFIMTDTQRKDMLGCYGDKDMKTPNLDRLAENGMKFENAYTTQPVCGPARSAIFTGTYPHTNLSITNSVGLEEGTLTVGHRLNSNGIKTGYIGKWHLDGWDYFGRGVCPGGWDENYWYDMKNYLDELNEEEKILSRQASTMAKINVDESFTFAHRCTDRAIDFISKHKDEDFFLVVSYDEPHEPYLCPEPYASMYKDYQFPIKENMLYGLDGKPEHHKLWAGERIDLLNNAKNNPEIIQNYLTENQFQYFYGCNAFVDYEVGRILNTLDEAAINPIIMYTSDHGDMQLSHALTIKGPAMYEEITNVPFIVSCPGKVPNGLANTNPVSHIDILPTVLDYFNIDQSKNLPGKTLFPEFNSQERVNESIFMEFTRYEVDHDGFGGFQPIRAAFDGRYKLVVNLLTTDELYDLHSDPQEMNNLINSTELAEIRNSIHDKLLENMNITRDPFRGYYWERREWRDSAVDASWAYTGMTRQKYKENEEETQLDYANGLEIKENVRSKKNY